MSVVWDAIVVGCGGIGSRYDSGRHGLPALSHAGAYVRSSRTRLVAGVDPDPAAREQFQSLWGVRCFPELASALEEVRPQIFSLCGPVSARLGGALEALEAGAEALWCEKPLAPSPADGERLVRACSDRGVVVQVNFIRRFDPLHRDLAGRLAAASEDVRHVDVRYSGSLETSGSHALDLFRWLVGEPVWLQAVPGNGAQPLILMGTQASTACLAHVASDAASLFEVEIFTDGRRWRLCAHGEELASSEAQASLFAGHRVIGHGKVIETGGISLAMEAGVAALVGLLDGDAEAPVVCDGFDGLAELALRDAVVTSLRDEARVTLQ